MPVSTDFSCANNPCPQPPRKRQPPFSIRLSEDERARLAMEAAGAPLGAYIKAKALGGAPLRSRRSGLAIEDRQSLAKGLALLGRSGLAENIQSLADAARSGSLPFTPETENALDSALHEVRSLRRLFLAALGFKPEEAP